MATSERPDGVIRFEGYFGFAVRRARAFEAFCSCGIGMAVGSNVADEERACWQEDHPESPEHQPLSWSEYRARFPNAAAVHGVVQDG